MLASTPLSATATACLVALGVALLVATAGWWRPRNPWLAGAQLALLAGTALTATLRPGVADDHLWLEVLFVVLCGGFALLGGGPVTTAVFGLVDGRTGGQRGSMRRAAEVLRGGAWIGALERAAVFASLAAGWPEGIAISLAVKGLGRYPELRNEERTGIAERFLIGTFVSVLWAAACAATALLLTR